MLLSFILLKTNYQISSFCPSLGWCLCDIVVRFGKCQLLSAGDVSQCTKWDYEHDYDCDSVMLIFGYTLWQILLQMYPLLHQITGHRMCQPLCLQQVNTNLADDEGSEYHWFKSFSQDGVSFVRFLLMKPRLLKTMTFLCFCMTNLTLCEC